MDATSLLEMLDRILLALVKQEAITSEQSNTVYKALYDAIDEAGYLD